MKGLNRFLAVVLTVSMSAMTFVGCGSSGAYSSSDTAEKQTAANVVETDTRTSKDGWDDSTNQSYTYKDLTITLPYYFGEPNENNAWYMETGRETSMFQLDAVDVSLPAVIDEDFFTDVYKGYIEGMEQSGNADIKASSISEPQMVNVAGYSACVVYFEGTANSGPVRNVEFENYLVMIGDSGTGSIVYVDLCQSKEAKYNYVDDFGHVLDNITVTEVDADGGDDSDTSMNNNDSSDDANEVTPELKAFLDSYEAFVDEYVAFMTKYQQDPTNTELLMEYANIMNKYSDFMQKIDEYDSEESEMSTADLNYYIEVTTRCSQKLLNAAAGEN